MEKIIKVDNIEYKVCVEVITESQHTDCAFSVSVETRVPPKRKWEPLCPPVGGMDEKSSGTYARMSILSRIPETEIRKVIGEYVLWMKAAAPIIYKTK